MTLKFKPVTRVRGDFRENFDRAVKASWRMVQIETSRRITFKFTKRTPASIAKARRVSR